MCRLRIQKLKIGHWGGFEKIDFFSFFLMRKRLSSGQKWFLRPYFPLIRGMFLLRSGLRFSFRALEVPEPRVRKRPLSLSNVAFIWGICRLIKKRPGIKSIYNLQLENAWESFVKWTTQRAIYILWFVWEYFLGWERMEICKTSYLQFTAKPRSRFTSSASHCRPCSQMLVSLEITQEIWAGTMNIKD